MKKYTYNSVIETYGEAIGLIYENIVYRIIQDRDLVSLAFESKMLISEHEMNLMDASSLVKQAALHAEQEISDSEKNSQPKITGEIKIKIHSNTKVYKNIKTLESSLKQWELPSLRYIVYTFPNGKITPLIIRDNDIASELRDMARKGFYVIG